LLSGTEFEPTDFQLIVLEGMNPILRYLVVSEYRKRFKEGIFGDMRLANFKLDDKNFRKFGKKGWGFVKKKSKIDFDVGSRVPINFRLLKWMITPQQANMKAAFLEVKVLKMNKNN
jgi:hypothetical protein